MKNDILNSVKEQLANAVSTITLENLDESKEQLITYFDFLHSLKNLPTFGALSIPAPVIDVEEESKEPVKASVPGSNAYSFHRKLRGGIVQNLNGRYPLPEKLVRDMGLEHGDQIKVVDTIYINGQPRDRFEIVDKGDGTPAVGRVQLDYCIVEEATGFIGYETKQCSTGAIMVDGVPFSFQLSQKDTLDYNVQDGDLVDIAYYENNLDSVRIIWKHDVRPPAVATTKQAAPKKQMPSDDATDESTKYPINLTLFKTKTLVIVGSMYEKSKYQKACDMLGINLIHMSGDEGKVRLRTAIKKADVVVITTQYVGHKGSVPTAELCKEYDVPMASVDRNGVQYILLEAERVIQRKLDQVTA